MNQAIEYNQDKPNLYLFRGAVYDILGDTVSAKSNYLRVRKAAQIAVDRGKKDPKVKLFDIGTLCIIDRVLGKDRFSVLRLYNSLLEKGHYDEEIVKKIRGDIFRFSKSNFLNPYRRGML